MVSAVGDKGQRDGRGIVKRAGLLFEVMMMFTAGLGGRFHLSLK